NTCGACDACGVLPEWLALPSAAEKPKRRRESSLVGDGGESALAVSSSMNSISEPDSELREYLRDWRRNIAREQGIPAFVVMHDTTIESLCRIQPQTLGELRHVQGLGVRKLELYGSQLLSAMQRFRQGARALTSATKTSQPAAETARLLREGRTLQEVANARGRQLSSVVALVAEMVETGQIAFHSNWMDSSKLLQIEEACSRLGTSRLRPIKDALPAEITFDDIRLVIAKLRAEQANPAR